MSGAVLAYCRPGYEADSANEITAVAAEKGWYGYPKLTSNNGYLTFNFNSETEAIAFSSEVRVCETIFPRQLFRVLANVEIDSPEDRIGPILSALEAVLLTQCGSLWVEHPDTEDGKTLAKLCRKFAVPLRVALRKKGWLSAKEISQKPSLHVFFVSGSHCFVGIAQPDTRSPFANGICRLKFPQAAPSRSTLKLEEALLTMLTETERASICREGARATDLGACPGGWTYQLVKRDMHVEAVDNGKMADSLMATGLVDYHAADGFKYHPQFGHVELLVCDMIEKPDRVAELMADWQCNNWCNHAIFNLKLPMKRRYETVTKALAGITTRLVQKNVKADIQAKHLYHNRDEVTVTIIRKNSINS